MNETAILRIDVRRKAVAELGERLDLAGHDEAMAVRDLEDLIADAIEWANGTYALARRTYDRFGRPPFPAFLPIRDSLLGLLDAIVLLCERLEAAATNGFSAAYDVEGLESLRTARGRLVTMAQWLPTVWRDVAELFDPAEMLESIAEADRGELIPHEEVWRRLGKAP